MKQIVGVADMKVSNNPKESIITYSLGSCTLSKIMAKTPFELDIPKVIDESNIPESQLFNIIETTESLMAMNIRMD